MSNGDLRDKQLFRSLRDQPPTVTVPRPGHEEARSVGDTFRGFFDTLRESGILGLLQPVVQPLAEQFVNAPPALPKGGQMEELLTRDPVAAPFVMGAEAAGSVAGLGRSILLGQEEAPAETAEGTASPAPEAVVEQAIAKAEQDLNKVTDAYALMDMIDETTLTPEQQQQLQFHRENTARELDRLNAEIAALQREFALGQQLYGNLIDAATAQGVLPPLDSEARQQMEGALDQLESGLEADEITPGLSPEVFEAIAAITDAQFTGNREQAIDIVMAKGTFEATLRNKISSLVQNREDLKRNAEQVEATLIAEGTMPPVYDLRVDPTPQGFFNETYIGFISDYLDNQPNATRLTEEEEGALADNLLALGSALALEGPDDPNIQTETEQQITAIAEGLNVDPTGLIAAVRQGREVGLTVMEEVESAPTAAALQPGGPGMASLIFNVAVEEFGDPELANALANSGALHLIIDMKSGGRAGVQRGDQVGVGGLSTEVYEPFGGFEQIRGNLAEEVRVLLRYILHKFQGSPEAALRQMQATGEWGEL